MDGFKLKDSLLKFWTWVMLSDFLQLIKEMLKLFREKNQWSCLQKYLKPNYSHITCILIKSHDLNPPNLVVYWSSKISSLFLCSLIACPALNQHCGLTFNPPHSQHLTCWLWLGGGVKMLSCHSSNTACRINLWGVGKSEPDAKLVMLWHYTSCQISKYIFHHWPMPEIRQKCLACHGWNTITFERFFNSLLWLICNIYIHFLASLQESIINYSES